MTFFPPAAGARGRALPGASLLLERLIFISCLGLLALAGWLAWDYDTDLLLTIYPGAQAGSVRLWRLVSMFGSNASLAPAVVGLSLLLWLRRQTATALWLALGWGMTSLTVEWLKWLLGRERPPVPFLTNATGRAFPSGHAADSLYVFLYLFLFLAGSASRRNGSSFHSGLRICLLLLLAVLPLAIGYSRVYLGVHWPSDVLGGWAVALLFLGIALLVRPQDRKTPAPVGSLESAPTHSAPCD